MKPNRLLQQGFAAIAAIFLVVVLAAMGTYMVAFSNTQQLSSAQDLQGSRAYWAARAGLEWGLTSAACNTTSTALTIQGFTVNVSCTPTVYPEADTNVTVVRINAIASAGSAGSLGYVERSVSATMER